jgi:hypothetical protein
LSKAQCMGAPRAGIFNAKVAWTITACDAFYRAGGEFPHNLRAPPPYRRETIREREGVTPSHLPSSNPQKRKTPAGSPQPAFCLRSAKAYSAAIAGSAM